ncbi:hypothetical protein Pla8534_28810 [Lignipirellula cremea]|uniref:Uncharacterized protein n=1 Tax=Lignipirellula cremea TaxID=2528010 RepID=A0A518DT99_9BACT|nr:hypothetical protein Pla8534_28810 [Lignipirellula cremea]
MPMTMQMQPIEKKKAEDKRNTSGVSGSGL